MLFLGEKGQAKSRLMRSLVNFLDEEIPYLDIPGVPIHEDPLRPITTVGKRFVAEGIEGLANKAKPGGRRKVTDEYIATLEEALAHELVEHVDARLQVYHVLGVGQVFVLKRRAREVPVAVLALVEVLS